MIYIVSGSERTGTSMMMKCLIYGGYNGLISMDLGKTKWNPDGIFEAPSEIMYTLAKADGFLVKVMGNKLANLKYGFRSGLKVIYMIRDTRQSLISHSLMAGVSNNEIKKLITDEVVLEKENQQKSFIKTISNREDVRDLISIDYNDVIANPLDTFNKLKIHGWDINVSRSVLAVTKEYCHTKKYKMMMKRRKNGIKIY